MCGIVGYSSENDGKNIIIEMLEKLEYRGYDSAGISCFSNGKMKTIKSVGEIEQLKTNIKDKQITFSTGIGHTRWATHGIVNENNCHPQLSQNKKWSVVHNGIVENYEMLKKEIQQKGLYFSSQTDTEVIANLFEINQKRIKRKKENFINVFEKIKGSYAVACLCEDFQDTIFLAKNKSPLYIAKVKDQIFIASDPIAFSKHTNKFFCFEDQEYAIVEKNEITFYDSNKNVVKKNQMKIDEKSESVSTNIDNYFMLKEIKETPFCIDNLIKNNEKTHFFQKKVAFIENYYPCEVYLIGCGTAYHACKIGEYYFENIAKIKSRSFIASEERDFPHSFQKNTLCIFVSQSGETADTIACLENCKNNGAKCVAVVNSSHSTIARLSDIVIPIFAGPEFAVASTKAYVSQLATLFLLASSFSNDYSFQHCVNKLLNLTKQINLVFKRIDEKMLETITEKVNSSKHVFFLGKCLDYITAQEASLKLKEITYVNCSAIQIGELKHGTLALFENNVLAICILTNKNIKTKCVSAMNEIKARGGSILLISSCIEKPDFFDDKDLFVEIPTFDYLLSPAISILPLQLLAFKSSIKKGFNPDKPRNLAKSVTVE